MSPLAYQECDGCLPNPSASRPLPMGAPERRIYHFGSPAISCRDRDSPKRSLMDLAAAITSRTQALVEFRRPFVLPSVSHLMALGQYSPGRRREAEGMRQV